MTALPSEVCAVLGTIDPVSQGAATVLSDYVDMSKWGKLMVILSVGVLGASATVDAKLRQATDGSGTGVKDITGTSIATLTQAGTDDNKQVIINLDSQALDRANNFDFAALSVTVGVAACLISAVVLGFEPKFAPANDNDITSVNEIV